MLGADVRDNSHRAARYSPASAAHAAKFRLPPPKAPKNQILSPGAIAKSLKQRGYAIEKMKRNGTTYSVTATSKARNKVQMTVDGRSGDIVGLAVLQAAPNLVSVVAAIVKSGKGTRYIDDSHPFGIIIPDIYQTRWVSFTPSIWVTCSRPCSSCNAHILERSGERSCCATGHAPRQARNDFGVARRSHGP